MMKRKLHILVLCLFGLAYWLFLAIGYHGHLHAAEGDSIFLFTPDYAADTLLRPGGAANYLGDFIVQFFHLPWIGALLVALLLTGLAAAVASFRRSDALLPLALVPSLAYAVLLCDAKWTIAGLAGLTAAVAIAAAIARIRVPGLRIAAALMALPLTVWLFLLPQFYIYLKAPAGLYAGLVLLTAAICVLLALVKAPTPKTWISGTAYVLLLAVCAFGISRKYERLDEEIDRYVFLVRTSDWDGILRKAGKEELHSPLSTNAVNLALEMEGRLGEEMFRFYQRGSRSLINFEEKKMSSEILFRLGFVNEATHMAFEDMAANPSRKRGVYHLTRLARFTAVDSSNRRLTGKYLATLDRTLFYRHFNPQTGVRPEMEPPADFLFNYGDFQAMLEKLAEQRPDNTPVRNYLAASYLLTKNLQPFEDRFADEPNPPAAHREALQMIHTLRDGASYPQLQQYIDAYGRARGKESGMGRYANTYWYYYNFR